jgi:hypothetical protein
MFLRETTSIKQRQRVVGQFRRPLNPLSHSPRSVSAVLVIQAFRYELTLNDETRARFASHCGASRFAFNWGLALVKH